jgi:3'5'-cyclic nucleotide phosphodiesterase
VSEATARLLSQNGKGSWISQRKEMVTVKGKGTIQTYWLSTQGNSSKAESVGSSRDETNSVNAIGTVRYDDSARKERNVEWICQVLQYRIENVLRTLPECTKPSSDERLYIPDFGSVPLMEVAEIVPLRSKSVTAQYSRCATRDGVLDDSVLAELRSFVHEVAETYQSNPFHNFEHACHVTMSVNKLLSRVVSNDVSNTETDNQSYTNDILDPLAQLATVFAAVIHDADHRGKGKTRE